MNDPARFTAALLDANVGSTNVTGKQKISSMVFNTFDTITKLLQAHCGPYSSFAITHSVGDNVSEPVFTNDGINIVKSMSFLNPIQDFARRNIAYIGSRVETKVGDGTTTAMILASSFMKYMSNPDNKQLRRFLSRCSYTEMVECYKVFSEVVYRGVTEFACHVDVHNSTDVERVAYCQAYTSSHGDRELSTSIAGLFAQIPVEAWPYIYYYREPAETSIRYSVKVEDDQFVTKVTVMNKNMLNEKLGTQFHRGDADVIVYTDLLTAGNEITWNPLKEAIKNAIVSQIPLVVLCPDTTDGYTRRTIQDLLTEDTNHMVAVFTHHMEHPTLNDFRVLALLTKQPSLQQPYFFVHHVDVHCIGHELVFNELYKKSDTDVNPLLKDEDYPLFRQQVDEIKSLIDQAKEEAVNRDTVREITHYVSIYNRLLFQRKYMIVVGGLAYDNSAAMDVLMDTVNAVHHTLTEGYTGGSNTAFCATLLEILEAEERRNWVGTRSVARQALFNYHFAKAFLSALRDVYDGVMDGVVPYKKAKWADPVQLVKDKAAKGYYLEFDSIDGWQIKDLANLVRSVTIGSNIASVMQPRELIPEVISRIGEVCLKFLKTDNIVSENGVYTPPKKKSWFKRLFNVGS